MKSATPNRKSFDRSIRRRLGPGHQLAENTDLLIYLDFVLFIKRLARESHNEAIKSQPIDKKRRPKVRVGAEEIQKVSEDVLRKFRG
ncbi:hypothetical protein [Absidia glauca]|uniref:Transcription factor CBF/NF-Y/archaeal histone domain-containing protein n=1 Tax=Absidia glauca TaxID=4829 RepID=A0A168RQD0_ABSGL|nr:hypothetical protein [Absidia glauca]